MVVCKRPRWGVNRGMAQVVTNGLGHPAVIPTDVVNKQTKEFISQNISYFKDDESELGQRLYNGLYALQDGLDHLLAECEPVSKVCSSFDLSPEEPGNGVRSAVKIVHAATSRVNELLKQISIERGALLFSKKHYVKEVEAWSEAVTSLATMFDYLNTVMLPQCVDGELLPTIETTTEEIFSLANTVSQYAFYGRCHSFHYHDSMHKVFKMLNISLCAFSEVYYSDGGFMQRTKQSLLTGSKYLLNPEVRARRLVDVVQYCSVEFIKSFWAIADLELIAKLNTYVGYNIVVEERVVVPCEDMEITSLDGRLLVVKAPHSHVLPNPIPCYLLSSNVREGMQSSNVSKSSKILPKSDVIIYHCHGGGFISQSTKVQGVFLKEWCVKTNVPIFSIDYTLSPYAIFPRALEELLTSYVWMLNNFSRLGTTGKKIIITGDSAGGNMITAMTIKCLEMGIRPPDSMFLIYTPLSIQISPSPSRLLSFMDPLLPLAFALKCSKAYGAIPAATPDSSNSSDSNGSPFTNGHTNGHANGYTNGVSKAASLTDEELNLVGIDMQSEGESFVEVNEGDLKSESDTLTTISLASNGTSCKGPVDGSSTNGVETESAKDKAERSRKYVTEFLDKYVLDTRVDKDGHSIPILRSLSNEQEDETGPVEVLSNQLGKAKDAVWGSFYAGVSSWGRRKSVPNKNPTSTKSPRKKSISRPYSGKIDLGTSFLKGSEESLTLIEQFAGINITSDYHANPYFAPIEIFAKFPPTYFMTADYDFALDDHVMMAKRLRSVGVKTKLKVLPKLPHGFLNLTLVSKDAHDGNKEAIGLLKELIELNET